MKVIVHAVPLKLDLILQAEGYFENGEPIYRLEDMAAKLGVSLDKARVTRDKLMAEHSAGWVNGYLLDSPQAVRERQHPDKPGLTHHQIRSGWVVAML